MGLFTGYPGIVYPLTDENGVVLPYTLTDVTTRVKIAMSPEAVKQMTFAYQIKDGETPESIAFAQYGQVGLYWTIMHVNNIFDYLNDWCMSADNLTAFCEDKYGFTGDEPNYLKVMYWADANGNYVLNGDSVDPNAIGVSGYSGLFTYGYSGLSGTSGYSGYSGQSGTSGYSGYSGYVHIDGFSGHSGSGMSPNTTASLLEAMTLAYVNSTTEILDWFDTLHPVTYFEYESILNEKKREIRLIRKENLRNYVIAFNNQLARTIP
jgi:hypothetical protein